LKYHLRRSDREVKDWAAIEEVLRKGKYATLALCRTNEPYAVTLSYGYDASGRTLYFHCAQEGLKSEFVAANPAVCATIIEDRGYLQQECAHAYRSVVVRGKIEVLPDPDKPRAIDVLLDHLEETPEIMRAKLQARREPLADVQLWRLVIEEVTGKQGQ
jgi:hypothetical protein